MLKSSPYIDLTRTTPGRHRPVCDGFSLMEMMLSIAIIAVLSGFLYAGLQQARRRADQVGCTSNLKHISVASAAYSADHQGGWPDNRIDKENGNVVFMEQLLPYVGPIAKSPDPAFRVSPFVCPAERNTEGTTVYVVRSRGLSYAQNAFLQATGVAKKVGAKVSVPYSSELMLYMDFQGHFMVDTSRLPNNIPAIKKRHGRFANAAFADGSVRQVDLDQIPTTTPTRFWQGRD